MQTVQHVYQKIQSSLSGRVFGQQEVSHLLVLSYLVGGHVLLEGPPGVAKTLLARAFADALGLNFRRIQFTPDLMPSDITGVSVFDRQSSNFRFSPGPLFSEIVLADEINRTPPKTQSALLEAMEEHTITVDGQTYPLGEFFTVIATQNSIEFEGTFPLVEAQLDRFLFRLIIGYPELAMEEQMVAEYSSGKKRDVAAVVAAVSREEILQARQEIVRVSLSKTLLRYLLQLVQQTRQHGDVLLGASPRSGLHLALAAKGAAALAGRDYVIPDDIQSLAAAVWNHRLILKPEAQSMGKTTAAVIAEVISQVPVPGDVRE